MVEIILEQLKKYLGIFKAKLKWKVYFMAKSDFSELFDKVKKSSTINLTAALDSIETAFSIIKEEIISRNRGGDKGMPGFIAEIVVLATSGSKLLVRLGNVWLNDNGPVDIQRGVEAI